ncbi:MAG: hypothetical protein ACYTEQ_27270 [Planctomycetota bacterium]|jgi:hypothetical protein
MMAGSFLPQTGQYLDPLGLALGGGLGGGLALRHDQQAMQNWLTQPTVGPNELMSPALGNFGMAGGAMSPPPMFATPQYQQLGMNLMGRQALNQLPLGPLERARMNLMGAQADYYSGRGVAATREGLDDPTNPGFWVQQGLSPQEATLKAREASEIKAGFKPRAQATDAPYWANPEDPNYNTKTAEAIRERERTTGPGISNVRGAKALELGRKIAAGQASEAEKSSYNKLIEGSQQTINIRERVPKQWYDDLEKNIVALDNIKRLKAHMQIRGTARGQGYISVR